MSRVNRYAKKTSRRSATTAGSLWRGQSLMTIWSRITPRPGSSTTSLDHFCPVRLHVLIQIAESCEREARRIFEFLGNQKSIMNDVLANVIDAHGGLDRWKKLNSVTATIFNGGRPTGAHRSSRDGAH